MYSITNWLKNIYEEEKRNISTCLKIPHKYISQICLLSNVFLEIIYFYVLKFAEEIIFDLEENQTVN